MSDEHRLNPVSARGFGRGAEDYAAARPGYPIEVLDLLVDEFGIGPGSEILDLAAGTGKLTELLLRSGADVIAVEPVAEMREQLAAALSEVEVLDGTAELLPLADGTVDAVTVGQAFHWFDENAALAEIRRVLERGGGLALIWNIRDERVAWVRELTEMLVEHGGGRPYDLQHREGMWQDIISDAGGFSPASERVFANTQMVNADLLVRRAASTSFVSALPEERRLRALTDVRKLVAEHPDLRGRERFPFPHDTVVIYCHRD